MKFFAAGALALMLMTQLAGCARTTQAAAPGASGSHRAGPATATGVRNPSEVQPCCRPLAEGRISLDACMRNPACVANQNSCCMNAIQ